MKDVIDVLAVFRLTKLVIDDELLADLRDKVIEKYPPESTKIGYLVTCPWCVSIYAGGVAVAGRTFFPRSWNVLSHALAYSAVTGMVYERL